MVREEDDLAFVGGIPDDNSAQGMGTLRVPVLSREVDLLVRLHP